MYKRYYDGYGSQRNNPNNGQIIVPEKSSDTYEVNEASQICQSEEASIASTSSAREKSFEIDDLILIGILIFLLKGCDEPDPIMIIVVGYLLLSELLE